MPLPLTTLTAQRPARLQAICEAIGHPVRRQILLTIHLRGGEAAAGAVASRFTHTWPTTTRHLAVLTNAGLLTHRRSGRERLYRLVPEAWEPFTEWLRWLNVPDR